MVMPHQCNLSNHSGMEFYNSQDYQISFAQLMSTSLKFHGQCLDKIDFHKFILQLFFLENMCSMSFMFHLVIFEETFRGRISSIVFTVLH